MTNFFINKREKWAFIIAAIFHTTVAVASMAGPMQRGFGEALEFFIFGGGALAIAIRLRFMWDQ